MYKKIYVPVDNSTHSNLAIESAVRLGKAFGAELVGSHIYAARMHDYRFKQMPVGERPEDIVHRALLGPHLDDEILVPVEAVQEQPGHGEF